MKRLKKFYAVLRKPLFFIGFIMLIVVVLAAIFANQIAPHAYDEIDLAVKLQAPSPEYPLGTDQYGRCIFSLFFLSYLPLFFSFYLYNADIRSLLFQLKLFRIFRIFSFYLWDDGSLNFYTLNIYI